MFEQGWKRMSIAAALALLLVGLAGTAVTRAAVSLPAAVPNVPSTTTTVTVPKSPITPGVTKVVTTTPVTPPPAPVPPTPVPRTPALNVPSQRVDVPGGGTVDTPPASVGGSTGGGGVTTGSGDAVRRLTGGGQPGSGTSLLSGGGPGDPGGPGTPAGGVPGAAAGPGGGAGAGPGGPVSTRSIARSVPRSGRVSTEQLVALVTQLQGCLAALPPLQRDLLIFRAGLDGGGTRSITALSRALNISPARAQTVQRRAVRGLRTAAAEGSCSGAAAVSYAAGLFASPALLGSPLGTLFGPDSGNRGANPSSSAAPSAGALTGARRTLGETLRDLGGESSPGPLLPALAILLFLAASVAALMREARRSI